MQGGKNGRCNARPTKPLRPSLALGHLPCEGRLFSGGARKKGSSHCGVTPRCAGRCHEATEGFGSEGLAEPARPEGLWHLSADSLFSYFLREESKQRSFQYLNQKAPADRSHAYRSAGAFILLVQNFFGSFFAKKEHFSFNPHPQSCPMPLPAR